MCLSWLRATRWSLRSLGYIFSAELCLLSCCLDSLPLHFNAFRLQGQTLFLTDLRRPRGVPSVPERFDCYEKKEEVTVVEGQSHSAGPFCPRSSSPEKQVHEESWCIKTALSEDSGALQFLKAQLLPAESFYPKAFSTCTELRGVGVTSSLAPSPSPSQWDGLHPSNMG